MSFSESHPDDFQQTIVPWELSKHSFPDPFLLSEAQVSRSLLSCRSRRKEGRKESLVSHFVSLVSLSPSLIPVPHPSRSRFFPLMFRRREPQNHITTEPERMSFRVTLSISL